MARSADILAIGLSGDTLLLCRVAAGAGKVEVKRLIEAEAPQGLDRSDAAAVGAWLGRVAAENKVSLRRVTFVAGREEVVLKRMAVAGGNALSPTELAGLVRLSLSRQMTMAIDGAGIDFVRLGTDESNPDSATVLAAALPADRLSWYRAVAGASGAKIVGIELSVSGVCAIARDAASRLDGPSMAIAIGRGAIEFVVLEGGRVSTARAVEIRSPSNDEELEQLAGRIVVEARRTWMGWVGGRDAVSLESILLMGPAPICDRVRVRCSEATLASAVRTLGLPPGVSVEEGADPGACLPMIGIAIGRAENLDRFDFVRVKRGPDPRARRRQTVLAGVFGIIIAIGGAWVVAQRQLGELRDARDSARQAMNRAGNQYADMLVQQTRVESVERWSGAGMDWLAHLRWLSDQMPDPKDGLLDDVSASMSADIQFTPRDQSVAGAQWTTRQEAVFSLSGKVVRREIALDLRGRLVRGDLYRVVNQSADTEDRFSFDLVTDKRSPTDPTTPAPPAKAKPGGSAAATPAVGGRGT